MKTRQGVLAAALLTVLLVPATAGAGGGPVYFDVPVAQLELTSGVLPDLPAGTYTWQEFQDHPPVVRLDGPGEAHLVGAMDFWDFGRQLRENVRIAIEHPADGDVTGKLVFPSCGKPDDQVNLAFRIPAKAATAEARSAFFEARARRYEELARSGIPGAAWFRHQAAVARAGGVLPEEVPQPPGIVPQNVPSDDLHRTFDMFTGNRALAENLQLDRPLLPRQPGEETVPVSILEGITVEEIDWAPMNAGKKPALDPLSAFIPADQHALFFPTFKAMLDVMDEADAFGTPVLAWLEPRSEDARTKDRYQKQLCLPVSTLARLLGGQVVSSVAFTGSDPFLRMGSDVAVLFAPKNATLLASHVRNNQEAAKKAGATAISGTAAGLAWSGVCTPDRSICSILAVRDDLVVVTNSTAQLERIARTAAGTDPALAKAPEYTYFRDRYPLSDKHESALLVVPDMALRRWAGPKWRIADSRRTRAAALLSELHVRHADDLVAGKTDGPLPAPRGFEGLGALTFTPTGIRSQTYGTLEFMIPVIELPLAKVTEDEAQAYNWFRNGYQQNWRRYFDPIALRLYVSDEKVALDGTILPLIAGSDYKEFVALTGSTMLEPGDADPHEETLVRFVMALNPDSDPVREVGNLAVSFAPGLQGNLLSWLGRYVSIYADQDDFWYQLAAAEKPERFLEANVDRLPLAVLVDVSSAMKVTAFLASVRAFVEQTAPGMTLWEPLTWKGQSYVKVSPTAAAREDDMPERLALYYAVTGKSLLITLNEDLLKRALERQAARSLGKDTGMRVPKLAGSQVGLQAAGELLGLLEPVIRKEIGQQMQKASFANLPILNEWRRLYPDRDPVDVHEIVFRTRLLCPGAGKYSWDGKALTMKSSAYGHPGAPKDGPELLRPPMSELTFGNFGLTFEAHDGLRVRTELSRRDRAVGGITRAVGKRICAAAPCFLCTFIPLGAFLVRRLTSEAGDLFGL
ncbi:MAG: hypothetical protein FJ109_14960 [Deltaproteobacteria bacterium]|nr:hypothetical protein [Deltaproteobacteria bacterium]